MNFYKELENVKYQYPDLYELITKNLINAKGRIEGQRLTEKYFNKNNLNFEILERYNLRTSQNLYDFVTGGSPKCSFDDCENERRWIGLRDGYKKFCEQCSRTRNNWLSNVDSKNKVNLELNEIYDYVKDSKGNYNTSKLLKLSDSTVNKLKSYTGFITWDAGVSERLYCYQNNIKSLQDLPKCEICQKEVTDFYASSKGYRSIHKGKCAKKNRNILMSNRVVNNNDFLTEKHLKKFLKEIYPNYDFIYDISVSNSNINHRPDFRNDELKLIIEFDGERHFCSSYAQLCDEIKDNCFRKMGYRIIRIPYFIQLSSDTIKYFFEVNVKYEQKYPHGFIDEKAKLPSDFNRIGYDKFLKILEEIPSEVKEDIENSLIHRNEDISKKYKISMIDSKKFVYFK